MGLSAETGGSKYQSLTPRFPLPKTLLLWDQHENACNANGHPALSRLSQKKEKGRHKTQEITEDPDSNRDEATSPAHSI